MSLNSQQLEGILACYKQIESELRVKLESLKSPLEMKFGRPVILFIESRTKKGNSLIEKARRYGWQVTEETIHRIKDIAGLRIIVQHLDDIDRVVDVLHQRTDLRVIDEKDFVRSPKTSGYRSYHLIVEYDYNDLRGPATRYAEIQVRTVGQHFWAVLQHSMMYKYGLEVPSHVAENLRLIAEETSNMDEKMMVMRWAVSRDLETDEVRDYAEKLVKSLYQQEGSKVQQSMTFDPLSYFEKMSILELSFLLGQQGIAASDFNPQSLARCSCCNAPFLLHENVRVLTAQSNSLAEKKADPVRLCKVCYSLIVPILRRELAPLSCINRDWLQKAQEETKHLSRKLYQFFLERVRNPLRKRLHQSAARKGIAMSQQTATLDVGAVTLFKAVIGDTVTIQIDSEWDPHHGEAETLVLYFKLNYRVIGRMQISYTYPEIEWDEFHEPEIIEPESFLYNASELSRLFSLIEVELQERPGPFTMVINR
ncbi:GTP pyrophosphokinase [Heliorestis convoluta]|uniref:RelA / SpoT region protein n=1 Tax=Heliorestis convoluta TaxID=356322 RepID=A0A5Q2N632_9FIRM|nr:hypothetical protein [Heliorestis convoluta]QGG48812.1 RelA / SpoT region protein [Heliorestis convoluta]